MFNRELMSAKTLKIYEELVGSLKVLKTEHARLIKRKNRTDEENRQLREIIKAHNACEKMKNEIWNAHSMVQIAIKSTEQKK
jgi:hypothetical protein